MIMQVGVLIEHAYYDYSTVLPDSISNNETGTREIINETPVLTEWFFIHTSNTVADKFNVLKKKRFLSIQEAVMAEHY